MESPDNGIPVDSEAPKKSPAELLRDTEAVCRVMNEVGRNVRAQARRDGEKIAVWRDERVVWLDPDEIDREIEERSAKK